MDTTMARKRIISPEFWSDEEIGQWSFAARLFYIGLWNFADDEGRFKAHNKLLKSQIFPYDNRISMVRLKQELGNKAQWYTDEKTGCQYGYLRNFLKHQRIDHASTSLLPPPPKVKFDEQSTNVQGTCPPNIIKDKTIKFNISENLDIFDSARKIYPGKKRGCQTEFDDFTRKHKDWKIVLPLLKPAIEGQITCRVLVACRKPPDNFLAPWKDFKTWLYNRCWEEETTVAPQAKKALCCCGCGKPAKHNVSGKRFANRECRKKMIGW